jgi:hypothetical protein
MLQFQISLFGVLIPAASTSVKSQSVDIVTYDAKCDETKFQ